MNRYTRTAIAVLNASALFLGVAVLAGCTTSGPSTSATNSTLTEESADALVEVSGMSCPQCAHSIVLLMDSYEEIQDKQVDLGRGVVRVKFAPGKSLSAEQLQKLIQDAGFTAGQVTFSEKEAG